MRWGCVGLSSSDSEKEMAVRSVSVRCCLALCSIGSGSEIRPGNQLNLDIETVTYGVEIVKFLISKSMDLKFYV